MDGRIGTWVSTQDGRIVEVTGECADHYIGREINQSRLSLKYGEKVKILKDEIVEDEEE